MSRNIRYLLLAVVLLAAALRLYHLTYPGLWIDEFNIAAQLSEAPSWTPNHDRQATYVDFVFRQPLTKAFRNDFAFRLPSVIVGTVSIIALYFVSRKLFPEIALLAAFMVALMPSHIRYSQEGRYYIWMYFNTLLLTYALLRFNKSGKTRDAIYFALTIPLISLTQRTSIIVPWVICGSFVLFFHNSLTWRHWKLLVSAFALGIILSFPAYYQALALRSTVTSGAKLHVHEADRLQVITPSLYLETISQSFYTEFSMLGSKPEGLVDFAVIGLFCFGIVYAAIKNYRVAGFLLLCFFGLVTPIFLLSVDNMLPHGRYVYFAYPFAHILLALGVWAFGQSVLYLIRRSTGMSAERPVALGLAALVPIAFAPSISRYYQELKHSPKLSVLAFEEFAKSRPTHFIAPTQNSRLARDLYWYVQQDEALKGNFERVDAETTTTVLKEVAEILRRSPDRVAGTGTMKRVYDADKIVVAAFSALVGDNRAISVLHHDGDQALITTSELFFETDKEKRMQRSLELFQQLEHAFDPGLPTRVYMAQSQIKLLQQLRPEGWELQVDQLRSFILRHSRNPGLTASVHLEQGNLDAAVPFLNAAIAERKTYFHPYIQMAGLHELRFEQTRDPVYLLHAVQTFALARENEANMPAWTYQVENRLIQDYGEAVLAREIERLWDSNRKQAEDLMERYYKQPGRKHEGHLLAITGKKITS